MNRLKLWATLLFKDDLPEPEEPLLPREFFEPPRVYEDADITPNVIIHNHLATQDQKLNMIGHGMERIWVEMGYQKGVLGILKRIIIAVVLSATGYATQDHWLPMIETLRNVIR